MVLQNKKWLVLQIFIVFNIHISLECPDRLAADEKAAYKSGEMQEANTPVTLEKIKAKLKNTGVFDWTDPTLTAVEKKELNKLFDAVEIMTLSRARQPQNVQNMFSSLRIVERAVKKQMKEGQISESLANRFKWDKLTYRSKRLADSNKTETIEP